MVAYFLRWTLLKFFSSIPDEQIQQNIWQLGQTTRTVINTSNEIRCPLLWEFWIYNFSQRILERVLVGSIVNIRNECLFVWVHGEWIVARNKQIIWEPLCSSRDLFVPRYDSFPMNPEKKDTHSLNRLYIWMRGLHNRLYIWLLLFPYIVNTPSRTSTCFTISVSVCREHPIKDKYLFYHFCFSMSWTLFYCFCFSMSWTPHQGQVPVLPFLFQYGVNTVLPFLFQYSVNTVLPFLFQYSVNTVLPFLFQYSVNTVLPFLFQYSVNTVLPFLFQYSVNTALPFLLQYAVNTPSRTSTCFTVSITVCREHPIKDTYLFYRFCCSMPWTSNQGHVPVLPFLLQYAVNIQSRTRTCFTVSVAVCREHPIKDKYLFYRFCEDDQGVGTSPSPAAKKECEEELQDILLTLAQIGPDAMMRMILRKLWVMFSLYMMSCWRKTQTW